MVDSKLITLLKALKNTEVKEFSRYLESTMSVESTATFFRNLRKYHPEYANRNVNKVTFCKKFYPNTTPNSKRISKMMHQLVQCLQEFFILQEIRENEVEKDFLLLSAYRNRQLDKFFFKTVEQIEKKWNNNKPQGINHLHNEYKLKRMRFMHPNYKIIEKNTTETIIGPENLLEQIDRYYFATKLYLTLCLRHTENYIENKNKFSKPEYLVDEIVKITLAEDFKDAPQIELLSQTLNSFLKNNYENYKQLKNNFVRTLNSFKEEENITIINFLYTICYENYKMGKPGSLKELFELNCLMVKNNFLLDDGYIQINLFWNIINIGFAANELSWTKNFITAYGKFLIEEEKEDILCISSSMLAFEEGDFNKSLQHLAMVKFHNITYGLQARGLQMKCYYELGPDYEELLLSLVKSFKSFLKNNIFAEKTQKSVYNFIVLTKKLYALKSYPNKKATKKFAIDVNKMKDVAYRNWLYAKIKKIETHIN